MIRVAQPDFSVLERKYLLETFDSGQITQGPRVAEFEDLLARWSDTQFAVAVANGTVALHLALLAYGIGRGDEVIVPDLTFVATANAVRYCGATPVLVDIEPDTWTLDPQKAKDAITRRTRAIIPVHVYGSPADMDFFRKLAAARSLVLIEDAAEGRGGELLGQPLGSLSDAGTFSFYGNKVFTTGEGGAIVTNDAHVAQRLKFLRGQAMDPNRRYFHPEVGYNYRMTDLQAAIGLAQLARGGEILEKRSRVFKRYVDNLCYDGLTPRIRSSGQQAPWLFTILVDDREKLAEELHRFGVETRPTFVPLHRLPPFRSTKYFPAADDVGTRGISLPTHAGVTLEQVDEICGIVRRHLEDAPASARV